MKILKYIISSCCLMFMLSACSDNFSDRVLFEEDQQINTEESAFYSMMGILQQLQLIGDNYVILGEMRGDLMTVTENSTTDLRQLNSLKVDSTNSYVNPKSYYALVNNCNNLISKIDTAFVVSNTKVLKLEMKAAKTIRAWTYMQLFLNYGKVYYTTKPILSVANEDDYTVITDFNELSALLIADLLPWMPANGAVEEYPSYGTIGTFASAKLFIPVRFMLGELYLWRGDYALAANAYYQHILAYKLPLLNYSNTWNATQTATSYNWLRLFSDLTNTEQTSIIGFSDEYSNNTKLKSLTSSSIYMMAPSTNAISNWTNQVYSITGTLTLAGDLRGVNGSFSTFSELNELNDNVTYPVITKYNYMPSYVSLCRTSLIYLRYAEAVNRLGKPGVAFVFLKYGLTSTNLQNFAPKGIKNKEPYVDFGQVNATLGTIFSGNLGIHSRGCGDASLNNSYKFPTDGTDSITWVEDQLMLEYALETAYEGNRFNDLMRVANRRNQPSYLAEKIAQKFPEAERNDVILYLSDKKNWYLPEKK